MVAWWWEKLHLSEYHVFLKPLSYKYTVFTLIIRTDSKYCRPRSDCMVWCSRRMHTLFGTHPAVLILKAPSKICSRRHSKIAGLGGSVGCAVRLETRRSRVQPPPRSATFFRGDWSWNIFYGHSLPSADSRRAVVSFWRKNVHNTG